MGWSPELYLDEAMIEAEKIKLKTKSDFWTWGYAKYFPPDCLDLKLTKVVNWKLKSLGKAKSRILGYPEVAQKIQNNFPDTIWLENWLDLFLSDSKKFESDRMRCIGF